MENEFYTFNSKKVDACSAQHAINLSGRKVRNETKNNK